MNVNYSLGRVKKLLHNIQTETGKSSFLKYILKVCCFKIQLQFIAIKKLTTYNKKSNTSREQCTAEELVAGKYQTQASKKLTQQLSGCDVETVANARPSTTDDQIKHSTSVKYTCNSGYDPSATSNLHRTCSNGNLIPTLTSTPIVCNQSQTLYTTFKAIFFMIINIII